MAEMPVRIFMFESYLINAISLFKVSQMGKREGTDLILFLDKSLL
jgi:hypothetical protein